MVQLTRFTTAAFVLLAAFSAFLTTLGAFLAAALRFVLARAFSTTVRAFGATRVGLLLLVGLRRALGNANCERGEQQGEQRNENSALSGFHFCSPMQMMITVRHQRTHRHVRCETLAS